MMVAEVITDRAFISREAENKEDENHAFREFLVKRKPDVIDEKVFRINRAVTEMIDCTQCGGCCAGLMINIEADEIAPVAERLQVSSDDFKTKYVEESFTGRMIMNTIPCNFLSEKKCTVYPERFHECREFPHLHKPGFTKRLFGTLIHYAMCPIIYNVVERLKRETEFLISKYES